MTTTPFYQYPGALHMHTRHSDGTGTVQELVRAASQCGLRWIWITDHDTMAAREEEGINEGVVTLVGYEITPARNHYLVGDMDELVSRELPPEEYVRAVRAAGGVGVIAHPDERAVNEYTEPYRSDDWSLRGFDGIELWNYMSDWIEHYTPRSRYLNFLFPQRALHGPTPDTLRWWDALQQEGARPTGLFGVDAHATRVHRFGREWEVYSYAHCFARLVNYLQLDEPLSTEFPRAAEQIWGAIRRGRVLMANEGEGSAAGATFVAQPRAGGALATCGDTLPLGEGVTLEFACPLPATLRLLHNGAPVARSPRSQALRFDCQEPGHYRVEAHRGALWILSNPIHITAGG